MSDRKQANRIVDEEQVHAAMEYLRSSATAMGEAKGEAVKADKMLSHIEALCIKFSDEKSAAARQSDARASQKYVDQIEKIAAATSELRRMESLREAASAVIDVWRSEQATHRATRF